MPHSPTAPIQLRGPGDRHRRQRRPDARPRSAGRSTPPRRTTNIDSSPPALSNAASASFAFSGSDAGGSGVASFECRRDGASFAPCTSPQAYAALADGAHSFEVRAIDTAGNVDQTPASFSWTIDTAAPTTSIDSSPPALSNAASASFAFSGTDAGGSGVASFECRRDGASFAPCTSPQAYAALADGAHSFEVRAIDTAGNVDQSPATFSWSIDTAAPVVTIDSGPSGLTNDPTPTFTFSSEPGVSFECSIDKGTPNFGSCAGANSHTPDAPLADGPYTFRVRATDNAGNPGIATQSFTLDTAAPPAPQLTATVPASPANQNSPKVIGSAPAGSTVRLYTTIDCSGTPIATISAAELATGVTVSVPDDTTTRFRATVTDEANNPSACSTALTYIEDSSAPQTQIDTHPSTPSGSASASFAFSGTDAGGSGIASFECRIDRPARRWAPAPRRRASSNPSDGAHQFEVRAIDTAGNVDQTPASFSWSIDTAAPTTSIDSSPPALSNAASASFAFSGSDAGGSGVASFECRRDGASFAPCTSPQAYAALADGAHSFEVRAIDTAGNVDQTPASFSWSIDTAAPTTNIDSSPPALSNAASASFAFSGSDAGGSGVASFECRRDGASFAPCTSPQAYAALADGAHSFEVRAIDTAGNVDQTPASFSWSIDTAAPTTSIDSSPPALSNAASASFAFSGTDAGGSGVASFECRRDGASFAPCTSPQAYAALADGAHSFEVRAIDTAGNVDQSPATFSWSIDTAAPVVTIDSGPSGLTNDPTPTFTFSSEPGVSFECSIDKGTPNFGSCAGANSHTPDAPLADGPYTFRVRATDNAGNPGIATQSFTLDTAAPPAPQLTATVPASPANQNSPKVIGSAPAGSTVRLYTTIDCSGTPIATISAAELATGVTVSVPDDTTTRFRATVTDEANNPSACSAALTYIEDSSAPQTQIDTHPSTPSGSASASFTFSGSDPGGSGIASFECRRDGAAFAPCTSPQAYAALADGAHTFEVRAIDTAGNVDQTPASFSWIDRHRRARRPSIDSSPPALSNAASASFAFSGTDAGGSGIASFECRRDGASFAPCTSPQAYAALADGAHSFEVRAIDTAGNVDQTPAIVQLDYRHRRADHQHRLEPAGAERTPPRPASPSRGATPAAPASPPSNAGSTRPRPRTGGAAARRRATRT